MTTRRSFFKSLLAAVALSPLVCRLRSSEEVKAPERVRSAEEYLQELFPGSHLHYDQVPAPDLFQGGYSKAWSNLRLKISPVEPLKLWDFVEGELPTLLRLAEDGIGVKIKWSSKKKLTGYQIGNYSMKDTE